MEAIILSKEQYDGLISKINEIHEKVNAKTAPKQEVFLDNEEFIKTMKISRRTAQTWRDEGKISFSQVGNKIYYKLSDVEKTMQDHYNKSFAKKWITLFRTLKPLSPQIQWGLFTNNRQPTTNNQYYAIHHF